MAEGVDDGAGSAADELPAARPPVDRVGMAAARARAEQSLFGSTEPARLSRYVLLGGRADGGMGVVYSAYDPDLHRKVALKVLHPRRQGDDSAHERLIAEARALAQLDHANVVRVHDVLSLDGQVVIVMEWVEGTTLASWEREPRSWRDIVAVYVQAGHGLAAAHSVGVVHRDFKPANAIIGRDGRVRVLDFGLARPATDVADPAAALPAGRLAVGSGDRSWAAHVTATGDLVGTLGYAAPEQLAGKPATPASDQFSFGVALHRALEGVAPFAGDSPESLLRNIRAGRILRAENRALRGWLRAVIQRSLAAAPDLRFPSMAAVLAEVTRARGWRRWRLPLAVTTCALAAILVAGTRPSARDPLADCDGGATEIAGVWNAATRTTLQASLDAIATPAARDVRDRVLQGLDGYRDRWRAQHRDACVAHRGGIQSATLLDRRMLCIQRHLSDLRASVAVLGHLDATSVANASEVVAGMRSVAECGDREHLEADTEPPATPVQRTAVNRVRTRLSQAAALDRAGRSTDALVEATAAAGDAERSAYPPVVADAALLRGRILMSQRDLAVGAAAEALGHAQTAALEQHRFEIAVEAAARRIFIEGMANSDLVAAERKAAIFLPISKGLKGDHFARPLLLNNLGNVALAAQDRAKAVHYFQAAHDALADVVAPDLELTVIDENLALVTDDARRREQLARSAWERFHAALGEANLHTIEALDVYARITVDPARTYALLRSACTAYDQFHADMVVQRVFCRDTSAFLAEFLGDRTQSLQTYQEMVALAAGSTDDDLVARGRLAAGHVHLLQGDPDGAAAAWKPIIASLGDNPSWWARMPATHARLGLGLVAHARGRDTDAIGYLEPALASYREAAAMNAVTEYQLRLTLAEQALFATRANRAH